MLKSRSYRWEVLAQLCFDPQNEQQVKKSRRTNRAYGGLPLSDPPWACLLLKENWKKHSKVR